jgi:zinc protease
VSASFNPTLIQKGEDATRVQINKWIDEGLSETELENKKSNLIGSFKVRLSTTGGLASSILSFINEGKSPAYIDEYPKEIKAVTLNQVNSAIKKYINPASFLIIKSGSIDQQGNPKN